MVYSKKHLAYAADDAIKCYLNDDKGASSKQEQTCIHFRP